MGLLFGWTPRVLPYVEQENLQDLFDLTDSYNAVDISNNRAMKVHIQTVICPSAPKMPILVTCCAGIPGPEDGSATNYSATATHLSNPPDAGLIKGDSQTGSGIIFTLSATSIHHVTDGTSNTFMLSEIYQDYDTARKDWYAAYGDAYCPNSHCHLGRMWAFGSLMNTGYGINRRAGMFPSGVDSFHPGGACFSFADGHVAFLDESTEQAVLDRLTTRNGGEVISD